RIERKTARSGAVGLISRRSYSIPYDSPGVRAGRDIVSHGTAIRSNTFSAARSPAGSPPCPTQGLGMGENILGRPAGKIEPDPVGQEAKAGFGELPAPFAGEDGVELLPQGVQVQDIGRRIGELRLGEGLGAPIGELLLLGQIDAQHL